jgi:Fe-S cluster assembly ATP-binding protein
VVSSPVDRVLELRDLSVAVGGRVVVKRANIVLEEGSTLFLLGPNGSGKSTLLRAIIGYPGLEVLSGSVIFEDEDVTNKPMEYRVSKGLALAHQIPPQLSGVRVRQLLEALCRKTGCDPFEVASYLEIKTPP